MLHRITQSLAFLLLIAFSVSTMGCDSGESDSDPTVSGSWSGTAVVSGVSLTLNLQLTENSKIVSGAGTLSFDRSYAIVVNGTHNYPEVAMNISTELGPLNYTGTLAGDDETITGNMSGGGIEAFSMTIRKQ
jgi:hypothetical protein